MSKKLNEIVKSICLKEGKKHQASVGDVREIVKIISEDIKLLTALVDIKHEVEFSRAYLVKKSK